MKTALWLAIGLALSSTIQASPIAIGLVPDSDPERMSQLVQGLEWAIESYVTDLKLVVGRGPGHWGGLTEVIEELIEDENVALLIAPGDRQGAHLLAQIATRRQIPSITTLPPGDAGQTGSKWFVTCEIGQEEQGLLETKLGRPALAGELAGWSAAFVALALVESIREKEKVIDTTWVERLPDRCKNPSIEDAQFRPTTERGTLK